MSRTHVESTVVPQVTPDATNPRRRFALAPVLTFLVLVIALLEGPALARATGLSALLPQWNIKSVSITGDLYQISRDALREAITEGIEDDFFATDVGEVRKIALGVAWVDEVSVRKVWPGKLHVQVRERQAAARWHAGGLVDIDGAWFHPGGGKGLERLPVLRGPDGTSVEMLKRLRVLSAILAPVGQDVVRLELNRASGWQIELAGGLTLVAEHDFPDSALNKIAQALPSMLGDRFADAENIDLRYANGFAVRFKRTELAMGTSP